MKIRAIGTGGYFCRHPLTTSSFLIQSESSNIIIGCGPNIPAKLETINLSVEQIDMWVPLSSFSSQVAGLEEIGHASTKTRKPYLVAPADVLKKIETRLCASGMSELKNYFEVRASAKVSINEEHLTETITFVRNYLPGGPSYGISFEESEIFITGDTPLNEEFLHRYGMPAEIILHSCACGTEELEALLPMYLQKKIWLYGYHDKYLESIDPLPMLYLPQGTCIYDSDRKEKHLDKERFLRENAKRQIGNINSNQ